MHAISEVERDCVEMGLNGTRIKDMQEKSGAEMQHWMQYSMDEKDRVRESPKEELVAYRPLWPFLKPKLRHVGKRSSGDGYPSTK